MQPATTLSVELPALRAFPDATEREEHPAAVEESCLREESPRSSTDLEVLMGGPFAAEPRCKAACGEDMTSSASLEVSLTA